MSAAPTPARHLLALLEDEQALEARPLDDILADLSAHGVDPAGPIRLARGLAGQSAGPAAALLGAVVEDEAAEAEIAALETADIDAVRGRLEAGTVAAVAAEARRRAGGRSNVVGLRRRRGAAWAWAGSLVGMAACALIVVTVWWPDGDRFAPAPDVALMEAAPPAPERAAADMAGAASLPEMARATPPVPEPQPQSAPASTAAAIEADPAPDRPEPAGSPEAVAPDDLSEQRQADVAEVPAAGSLTLGGSAPTSVSPTPPLPSSRPDGSAGDGSAADPAADPPAAMAAELAPAPQEAAEPPPLIADTLEPSATAGNLGPRSEATGRGLAVVAAPTDLEGYAGPLAVVALVVVDPLVMPAQGVPALAADAPVQGSQDDPLARRVAEAQALAGDRHLVALATVREGTETHDTAIVMRDPAAEDPPPGPRDPLLAMLYGQRADVLETIRLPPRLP